MNDSLEAELKMVRWKVIENVVTITASCLTAYFISPWCFLLLLNLNGQKRT